MRRISSVRVRRELRDPPMSPITHRKVRASGVLRGVDELGALRVEVLAALLDLGLLLAEEVVNLLPRELIARFGRLLELDQVQRPRDGKCCLSCGLKGGDDLSAAFEANLEPFEQDVEVPADANQVRVGLGAVLS